MSRHAELGSLREMEGGSVVENGGSLCSWLCPGLLLLVSRLDADEDDLLACFLEGDRESCRLEVRSSRFKFLDHRLEDQSRDVLTVSIPRSELGEEAEVLKFTDSQGRTVAEPVHLEAELTDLRTLLRGGLACLDARARERALAFVLEAPTAHGLGLGGKQLSRSLRQVREALRERLPLAVVSTDIGRGLAVDAIMAVDERSFYAEGWLHDEEAPIVRLTAVSPEGERVDIQDHLFRYRRPDVEKFYDTPIAGRHIARMGFICFFQLERSSRLRNGWILEMENAEGAEIEVRAPAAVQDLADVRKRILEGLPPAFGSDELMEHHVHPAIERLQERAAELVAIQEVVEYGSIPSDAEVSIVVPFYRRIDFLEHQLAQFVHDPEMRTAELTYVLDSPELGRSLTEKAVQLHELYRIPFRVVLLERNSGFAAANKCGASASKAPLLLFMNSDILPDQAGWLGAMTRFYRSKPNIGALGPKLLYEDGSLQHAGMYFTMPKASALAGLWANWHYYKGLNRSLPAANVARPVPAVTGACLMVARDLFERVGGFQNTYVQGDHEDSDLCLRLIEEGLENWYLPEVELYHLEARSYPSDIRERTVLYNRWVHSRMWGDRIGEIMASLAKGGR